MVRISLGQRGFRAPDGRAPASSAGDAAVRPIGLAMGISSANCFAQMWVGQRTRSCRWRWVESHRRPGGVLQRVNPAKAFEALRNSPETVAGTCLHDANEFSSDILCRHGRMMLLLGMFGLVAIGILRSIRPQENRSRNRLVVRAIGSDRALTKAKWTGV